MIILNREEMRRSVMRLAMEAVEKNKGTEDMAVIGIRTRGVVFAKRIRHEIERMEGVSLPFGILDIACYRDDLLSGNCTAQFKGSEIDFSVDGKNIVLCDDVLYTGRTVRAALAAIMSLGRPKTVRLYTMIDRGHRDLPFRADGVGKNVPTSSEEKVKVHFMETDGEDSVILTK